ncbi:unnamed protein product [Brugia timori]|uniref:Protein outspread n=1 Tax=Brugia timori TaxID=42155 RepID=A0A0R3RAZ5_9BILA|nr:unnamed protein product [Brugia timori]
MSSEASCSGFEPQIYLRERCKNCFSLRSKHDVKNDTERTAIISNNTDNNSTNQKQQQESLVTLNMALDHPSCNHYKRTKSRKATFLA